jgi:hypothetical protein
VTATFNLIPYPLTVAKAGTGSGAVTASPAGIGCGGGCSHAAHAYDYGTTVTLSESPAGGSSFAGWSGACTGTGACRVSMTAARSVTAVFSRVTYTLAVAKTGTGSGTVVSTPAGVSCGSDCSQPYNSGTTVVLTADTATGSRFGGWSGACTGTGSCQVTMNAARSVTASFVKSATASLQSNEDENTLDVAIEGDGSGKVFSSPAGIDCGHDCATAYPRGSTVSVAATADPGSTFRGWRGACSGTGSCQLEMSQGRNVVATFSTPSPGGFYTVEPCRVLDTRLPSGPNGGPPLPAHMTRVFPLFGVCGIPTSARAVSLNVTVTEATSAGHLRVFPAGVPLPAAMSLSYAAGRTRANNVAAGLSRSGGLAIRGDQASGAVHVIVDVNGYYE